MSDEKLTQIRIQQKKLKSVEKIDRKKLTKVRAEALPMFENVGSGEVVILINQDTQKVYVERIVDRNRVRNTLDQYEFIGEDGQLQLLPLTLEIAHKIVDRVVDGRTSFNSCFVFGNFKTKDLNWTKSESEHKFTSTGIKFWRHQQQMFNYRAPINGSPRNTVISTHISPEGSCNLRCPYCFSGDTKISLLNGTEETLENLAKLENKFWVYSYDSETKKVVPGQATAFKTREKQSTVIVTLDSGEKIECTPDHKFMLRDGSYCEAQDLKNDDSLMPLYRRKSEKQRDGAKDYEQFLDVDTNEWKFTHQRVVEKELINSLIYQDDNFVEISGKAQGVSVRHHKNFKKWDNTPDNLVWMRYDEHIKLHSKYVHKLFELGLHSSQNPENLKKWNEAGLAASAKLYAQGLGWMQQAAVSGTHHFQNKKFQQQQSVIQKQYAIEGKNNAQQPEFKQMMSDIQLNLLSQGEHYFSSDDHRIKSSDRIKLVRKWEKYLTKHSLTKEQLPLKLWKEQNLFNEVCFKPTLAWLIRFCHENNVTSLTQFQKKHKRSVRHLTYATFGDIKQLICDNGYLDWFDFAKSNEIKLRRSCYKKQTNPTNHKVISVENSGNLKDVYCLNVEKYHNFALSAGVFVSNCSVTYRDTHSRIELSRIKQYVIDLKMRGLKAVILTGGGEPTLYPHFNELVQWLKHDQNLSVALITNGTTSDKIDDATYACFSWIRISINIFPGWEEKINLRREALSSDCVVGCSMVFTVEHEALDNTKNDRDEIFHAASKIADRVGATYIRLLPNCLLEQDNLVTEHAHLQKLLEKIGDKRFFQQYKVHGAPSCTTCHQAYFRPYLSEEPSKIDGKPGSVYPCDSVVLNDSVTHFAQKYQLCKPENILDFIDGKILPEFNPQIDCKGCVFTGNVNTLNEWLVNGTNSFDKFAEPLTHEEFV